MIKGLPLTSLIVLNTLCPCRRPEDTCCAEVPVSGDDKCCSCHLLTQGAQPTGEYIELAFPQCKWPFHEVINGHASFQVEAICLMRDYYAAVAVLHHFDLGSLCSEEEYDRLIAIRTAMSKFLSRDEEPEREFFQHKGD